MTLIGNTCIIPTAVYTIYKKNTLMKILKANKPDEGKTPIVIALSDLSNLKLRNHYNPETMNGRTKRYG